MQASTREGDWVLDFFAGSGTTGAAAAELGRRFVLVDGNAEAIDVMPQAPARRDFVWLETAASFTDSPCRGRCAVRETLRRPDSASELLEGGAVEDEGLDVASA